MASDKWEFTASKKNEIRHTINFHASVDSQWFKGHFPGMPILPGVALLHHAWRLVDEFLGPGHYLEKLSRVKFRRIIKPGTRPP